MTMITYRNYGAMAKSLFKEYLKTLDTPDSGDEIPRSEENQPFVGLKLPALLNLINREHNPERFSEAVLKATQLYFDGLIEGERHPELWGEQEGILDALLQAVRKTVSGYHDKRPELLEEARELMFSYRGRLVRDGSGGKAKYRRLVNRIAYVGWDMREESAVGLCAKNAVRELAAEKINVVVPIASGGFEPGALIAERLDVENIFPVRLSRETKGDKNVRIPVNAPEGYAREQLEGKNVVIVEDILISGQTLREVVNWVKSFDPSKVYSAITAGIGPGGSITSEEEW